MLSAEILRELREDHAKITRTCQTNVGILTPFVVFRMLSIMSKLFSFDYMHLLSSLYMLNFLATIYPLSKSGSTHARN